MIVLIDNGHGCDTAGKRSPDGRLLEWKWNREVSQRVSRLLTLKGVDVRLLVAESEDVSLRERVRRANAYCSRYGAKGVVLASIHVNAAKSDGQWHNASGFSAWVAPNASEESKRLARLLTMEFERAGLMGNRCVPEGKYWVGNLAIVRDTKCPAVLTENQFMDNRADVDYLMSEEGKQETAHLTVEGLMKYIETLK